MSVFNDLLYRADNLTNKSQGIGSSISGQKRQQFGQLELTKEQTRSLQSDLDDIFRRSDAIYGKGREGEETTKLQSNLFFSRKGITITSVDAASAPVEAVVDADRPSVSGIGSVCSRTVGEINLNPELMKLMDNTIERANLEAERSFINQKVCDDANICTMYARKNTAANGNSRRPGGKQQQKAFFAKDTLLFAQRVQKIIADTTQKKVTDAYFADLSNHLETSEAQRVWEQVITILSSSVALQEAKKTPAELRESEVWLRHLSSKSLQYLQKQYERHMEDVVQRNLEKAQRGGVPGVLSLVDAYLNVRGSPQCKSEDAKFGSHPTWCVLFHCLRVGDFNAVTKVAQTLRNIPGCAVIVNFLQNLTKEEPLTDETHTKVLMEWKYESVGCTDSYKKAAYCAVLGLECHEVNDSLEDWLWSRIFCNKIRGPGTLSSVKTLQSMVCKDFGEKYFMGPDGNWRAFFTALWLSGQLERGIELLVRMNHIALAVHAAMIGFKNKLLDIVDDVAQPLLVVSEEDLRKAKINFARLLLLYVKNFEMSNPDVALDYYFFLNNIQSPVGGNLFEACVSRIVYITGQTAEILGRFNSEGSRQDALIDRYPGINVGDVISRVAADTNTKGDTLQAVELYILAKRTDDAVQLLCKYIGTRMLERGPAYQEAIKVAMEIAMMHRDGRIAQPASESPLSTLYLMIDFSTFFTLCKEERYSDALDVIKRLEIVPLDSEEVHNFVAGFHLIPDEVQHVLPDLCLEAMTVVVKEFEHSEVRQVEKFRDMAKAIILYTAMIPYRFPASMNTKLLEMQSRIN